MARWLPLLTTVLAAVVTSALVVLPVVVHAASCPDRSQPLPQFEASDPAQTSLPEWRPLSLHRYPALPTSTASNKAPGILAPIGAIGAGTVLPTVLFLTEINQSYEPYRKATGQHPAEFEPKFYGTALIYSTLSVSLAPAGASLFYMFGGGPVLRALGGLLFGLVFAVIALPVGLLVAMALTSSYQNNEKAQPGPVYTTYALSLYGTITAGSLIGFFLIGKRKKDTDKRASIGLAPLRDGQQTSWIPTLRGQF